MIKRTVKITNITRKTENGKFTHIREEIVKPGISKFEQRRRERNYYGKER